MPFATRTLPAAALALAALAAPGPSAAQAAGQVSLPPTLALPNYHRVAVGLTEATEAGAYVARASGPSANWYNPAGLARADRTELNAASTGYEVVSLSVGEGEASVTSVGIDQLPSFLAGVVAEPLTPSPRLRLGFSLTKVVSWRSSLDAELEIPRAGGGERVTLGSKVDFYTLVPTVAAGYALGDSLQVGLAVGAGYTRLDQADPLSDELFVPGLQGAALRDARVSGYDVSFLPALGVQWQPLGGLELGVVLRAPGQRLFGKSSLTYHGVRGTGGETTSTYLRDDGARFEYRLPFEAAVGLAWRARKWEIEANVRYTDGSGVYDVVRSDEPVVSTTYGAGTLTQTVQPARPVRYAARSIWSWSLGGRYRLGPGFTVNAGFFFDPSPVKGFSPTFRHVDLYGLTAGASWRGEHLSFTLGANMAVGRSELFSLGEDALEGGAGTSRLEVFTASLLYAISYRF